jgi:hypothetical protein
MAKIKVESQSTGTGIYTLKTGTASTNYSATLPDATGTLINTAPSTSGYVLTSDGTNWTSAAAAAGGVAGISTSSTSGTAISIDANNIVTKGSNPCFSVSLSGNYNNFPRNAENTIPFDTERFDIGSNFNTSTYTFTAPVTGKYQVGYDIQVFAMLSAANYVIYLNTSNNIYYDLSSNAEQSRPIDTSTRAMGLSSSFLVDMDTSDTMKLIIYQEGGTTDPSDLDLRSLFTCALIS